MKSLLALSLVVIVGFLAACASSHQGVALGPVGPAPFEHARHTSQGELVVYSALQVGNSSDQNAATHHEGYEIFSADGTRLKYVNNWVTTFTQDPAVVALSPGRYVVAARAMGNGTVKVSVVIEAGKTTGVHLDGSQPATPAQEPSEAQWARLPDGRIIGWRAIGEDESNH